jgi:hypothetical protein
MTSDTGRTAAAGTPSAGEVALPPADTRRWVARRKAALVEAVRAGVLDFEEACRRYQISAEEFASWEKLIDRHGTPGLRVTRLKQFRAAAAPPNAR